ncbi:Axonemal dynein light intermediate polypeptide 1 [Kappamyces sp. JEL0829]|nr:Axonemal dynein light intermediate polypeptide 1 [Kappamyces sp. JEL0829]
MPDLSDSPFVKPFKKRNLPVAAQKYKPKTPKAGVEKESVSRIPAPAPSGPPQNIPKIHESLLQSEYLASHLSLPKHSFESAGEYQSEAKIPPLKGKEDSKTALEMDSIYSLEKRVQEKRAEGQLTRRPVVGEKNALEVMVLKKIETDNVWEVEMLKELTRIIDPIYAADKLREHDSQPDHDSEAQSAPSTPANRQEYNFTTKAYDCHINIPSAGLFFSLDSKAAHSPGPEKSPAPQARRGMSFSRPISAYASSTRQHLALKSASPRPLSASSLVSREPAETPSQDHDDEGLATSYIAIDDGNEVEQSQEHPFDDGGKTPSRNSARSSSSKSNRGKHRVSYFPPAEVKLGGLGPDKDNAAYLAKLEMANKKKQYAERIRNVLRQKPTRQHSSLSEHEVSDHASPSLLKLPSISIKSFGESGGDDGLSKQQKMKLYAEKVKQGKRKQAAAQKTPIGLPPIVKQFVLRDNDSELNRLEAEHINDMKIVEEIRRSDAAAKKDLKGAAADKKGAGKKLPPVDDKRAKTPSQTEDILNSILPPREWDEAGQLWIQKVSSTPATRLDVINLQEQLDHILQKRQARETGIDPVRRELYSQCFDELIRQVTISCQERGLLLLRVRDEIRMSIAAYQTLYESSVAFGMRKALQAEQGKSDMEAKIKEYEEEKRQTEQTILELKAKCEAIEKRESERRAMEERKHAEEIAFLKKTNVQLKTQLEGILSPQKK